MPPYSTSWPALYGVFHSCGVLTTHRDLGSALPGTNFCCHSAYASSTNKEFRANEKCNSNENYLKSVLSDPTCFNQGSRRCPPPPSRPAAAPPSSPEAAAEIPAEVKGSGSVKPNSTTSPKRPKPTPNTPRSGFSSRRAAAAPSSRHQRPSSTHRGQDPAAEPPKHLSRDPKTPQQSPPSTLTEQGAAARRPPRAVAVRASGCPRALITRAVINGGVPTRSPSAHSRFQRGFSLFRRSPSGGKEEMEQKGPAVGTSPPAPVTNRPAAAPSAPLPDLLRFAPAAPVPVPVPSQPYTVLHSPIRSHTLPHSPILPLTTPLGAQQPPRLAGPTCLRLPPHGPPRPRRLASGTRCRRGPVSAGRSGTGAPRGTSAEFSTDGRGPRGKFEPHTTPGRTGGFTPRRQRPPLPGEGSAGGERLTNSCHNGSPRRGY